MTKHTEFIPDWTETAPPKGSYRSIFKWGAPDAFKHPSDAWYHMMKEEFGMTDADFKTKKQEGLDQVAVVQKVRIGQADIRAFAAIVGKENVALDGYSRLRYSRGKTMEEAAELRSGKIGNVTDVVLHPRSKEDVKKIVARCNKRKIPVYAYGGGSSVTLGFKPARGGVTLVLQTHMNRLLDINETNQTARVQPGMLGPDYEKALNEARARYGTKHAYTCGHFPQSFEYSSVGGWVVTLGSGQASTYYGDAYHIMLSGEYVTPAGDIRTLDYPGTATGPKVNDIMKGSEGAFGILVEVTMRIFRYMPENRRYFGYMFPTWEAAVNASREIMQGEFGKPAVYRISDPEETEVGLKLYGVAGTPADTFMRLRGFRPMERCLLLGTAEGERRYARHVKRMIGRICRRHGAMSLTGFAAKKWEKTRYLEPYMREDLNDYGIVIDTLESAVTWDNLHRLHKGVREFVRKRPGTICMTHASHFYPQGTNLYFIYIMKMESVRSYLAFQQGVINAITKNGGSPSHHHGMGRMLAPWLEPHLGKSQMAVLRTLKKHFDPNNIMNPGGTLGLG
ncbi:MAG: FAD-binding oxidoreductase [Spirochaetes bacterium]|nr:FAD-binding oxidoreductase [Spirochaetota bacterium]